MELKLLNELDKRTHLEKCKDNILNSKPMSEVEPAQRKIVVRKEREIFPTNSPYEPPQYKIVRRKERNFF
jgi:hypothetical protein